MVKGNLDFRILLYMSEESNVRIGVAQVGTVDDCELAEQGGSQIA